MSRVGHVARLKSVAAIVLASVFLPQMLPSPALAARQMPKTVRRIAISVNGTQLGPAESAELVNGRVYVPLRPIAEALHVGLRSHAPYSELSLPSREHLMLTLNQRNVLLEKRHFQLDAPVVKLRGRIYIPAELFLKAFGAIVRYNDTSAQVAILAHLENRPRAFNIAPPLTGTLTNVDSVSNPATVSVVVGDQVRTLLLRAGVAISLEDLVAGTMQNGTIADLHTGDLLTVNFAASGSVASLADSYRSRNGSIAAVAQGAVGLADGHVIVPTRSTTVTLNGAKVGLNALHVGDTVTVRSNPQSLEVREILAYRPVPVTGAPASVAITQLTITPEHALRAREELLVFMRGTAGGKATFDLGATATGVPMQEMSPGLYRGRYLVDQGASFLNSPVIGYLTADGHNARPVSAKTTFSAATLPPQIVDMAPNEGQAVNDTRSVIYATFTTPTGLGVDPARIRMLVNGRDVTALAQRTSDFVSYQPSDDLPLGPVTVSLDIADRAGNTTSYHWSFICGSAQ